MRLQGNPFSGTDFTGGGMPIGSETPPGPIAPANPLPPYPTLTDDPDYNARVLNQYLQTINQGLRMGGSYSGTDSSGNSFTMEGQSLDPRDKEVVDQVQKQAEWWAQQSALQKTAGVNDTLERWKEAQANSRTGASTAAQIQAAGISAGASVTSAGISAGASAYSADEATRRAIAQEQMQEAEAEKQRSFLGGESALTRGATAEQNQLNRQATRENIDVQQKFEGEQNALNREIQRIQAEIAAGNLNLNTASTVLQKWLDAQQYSLPKGAEYVPGFQPGGGAQEAARLAGVSYNPANYKANTVPFNPADVVRQTMGGR